MMIMIAVIFNFEAELNLPYALHSKNISGNSVVEGKMVIVHHHPNQALYQFPVM